MYQRGVGTQCAVFYIGWAHYFGAAGAFKQAESVYNLGFQAKAHPYEDLEAAHSKFRLSVAQRMLYDDSQSHKKRAASQLNEQRQAIPPNNIVPAFKKIKIEEKQERQDNADCDLNNSAHVISSSLNSVYDGDGQTANAYDQFEDKYEPLGINIPSTFARYAKNNHETWNGALCMEEPYDPNSACHYLKKYVYPGNNTEYSPEEIRARRYAAHIAVIRQKNLKFEMERSRIKEEKQRRELEIKQREEEAFRMEQERQRIMEQHRLQQEQERARTQEYERIRIEQERQRVASIEYQRAARIADMERNREEQERLAREQHERLRLEAIHHRGVHENGTSGNAHLWSNGAAYSNTTTIATANNHIVQNTVTQNADSDDIEEQIEASTIRFSTDNGLTKPKTITIKFRKEKQPNNSEQLTSSSKVPSTSTTPKPKKEKKTKRSHHHHHNHHHHHHNNSVTAASTPTTNGNNNQCCDNKIDDANLLLSIANMHSSSNDDSAYSAYSGGAIGRQFDDDVNDDSVSNSEFNRSYPFSAENSNNGEFLPYNSSSSSTPIRGSANHHYIHSSTPHNFKILRKRTSNLSFQNDDSMCSADQNSFFAAENSEELKQKRLEKALATIETHLAKPALDPFNSELCKAFLTKLGFPSRENSAVCKIVNAPLAKLANAKLALLANIPFQIEKEVGRGSYGNVYK